MFNGNMKAITFSYDDGVTQDERLIKIFNKYGLKATFNINSELFGKIGELQYNEKSVSHIRVQKEKIKELYAGHEIAVHTLTHPNLTTVAENEIIRQVEEDRKNLKQLLGYDIVGMAYPCGGENNNDFVAQTIKNHTAIQYARTIVSTHSFQLQENLFRFHPTIHHREDDLFELGREFLALKPETPQLFYIWGHSYEFDMKDDWDRFEEFCAMISGHKDIFYGTNREVLLNK